MSLSGSVGRSFIASFVRSFLCSQQQVSSFSVSGCFCCCCCCFFFINGRGRLIEASRGATQTERTVSLLRAEMLVQSLRRCGGEPSPSRGGRPSPRSTKARRKNGIAAIPFARSKSNRRSLCLVVVSFFCAFVSQLKCSAGCSFLLSAFVLLLFLFFFFEGRSAVDGWMVGMVGDRSSGNGGRKAGASQNI